MRPWARRQSITRVVADLRAQGLIETRYGQTLLLDPEGLRQVMGQEPLPSQPGNLEARAAPVARS
jgi:1-acyl-sn-glycerol-3-phosphate acyltransferase